MINHPRSHHTVPILYILIASYIVMINCCNINNELYAPSQPEYDQLSTSNQSDGMGVSDSSPFFAMTNTSSTVSIREYGEEDVCSDDALRSDAQGRKQSIKSSLIPIDCVPTNPPDEITQNVPSTMSFAQKREFNYIERGHTVPNVSSPFVSTMTVHRDGYKMNDRAANPKHLDGGLRFNGDDIMR